MNDDRHDIAQELARLSDILNHRVVVVRVIVDADGRELGRMYRSSFIDWSRRTEPDSAS